MKPATKHALWNVASVAFAVLLILGWASAVVTWWHLMPELPWRRVLVELLAMVTGALGFVWTLTKTSVRISSDQDPEGERFTRRHFS